MPAATLVTLLALALPVVAQQPRGGLLSRVQAVDLFAQQHPSVVDTQLQWFEQAVDHFSWAEPTTGGTFQQRYFVNTTHWRRGGPIFFYCGNEASVELYVNSTGLMWENAASFGAALVFAEHRFYGESLPCGKDWRKCQSYLTMEQALADFAVLIRGLKQQWQSEESATIAFGGSYGGQLAAWLRIKYPSAVDGAIAGSAPIFAFPGPTFTDGELYWQVETRAATPAAGSHPSCSGNVRQAWQDLFGLGRSSEGRTRLGELFRTCKPLRSADVEKLAMFLMNTWDSMTMGNFPYPSNYLVFAMTGNAKAFLPAWPIRAACEHMKGSNLTSEQRLEALRDATGMFNNITGTVPCYEVPEPGPSRDTVFDYQWCTEMMGQQEHYTRDGVHDMFWPSKMNMTLINERCRNAFGVEPRPTWIATEFGGTPASLGATNIVFSNGALDPWKSCGVLKDVSESAVAVVIEDGAHHVDLMFSNPLDPESFKEVREIELTHMRRWIAEKRAQTSTDGDYTTIYS